MSEADPRNLADAHTDQPSLAGRKAIVTGGTTGIGRAIAVLLASEGAKVFVCGRTPAHLDDALERIREVGEGDGINVDLSNKQDVERFFTAAEEFLGGLDIAVINAAVPSQDLAGASKAEMRYEIEVGEGDGINVDLSNKQDVERFFAAAESYLGGLEIAVINAAVPSQDLAGAGKAEMRYEIEVDLVAYLTTTKAAVERMQAGSDVVLIGSTSAVSREAGSSIYIAAKAGIQGFAQALREELAERDIKVGLIEPGFTGADLQYPDFPPEKQRELIDQHKMLRAEDIAVAAHFMLTQPRRAAVSLVRVETRLEHP